MYIKKYKAIEEKQTENHWCMKYYIEKCQYKINNYRKSNQIRCK